MPPVRAPADCLSSRRPSPAASRWRLSRQPRTAASARSPRVSPNAHRIADAYWLILGVLAVVFVVVEAVLLTFVIRYRRRGRPRDAEPEQIHGDTRIEIAWTVAPVVLLAVIVAFVFYKLPGIKNTPRRRPQTRTSRRGAPVLLAVQVPERPTVDQRPHRAERPGRDLDVVSADVAHSWWVPRSAARSTRSPARRTTRGSRRKRPGRTTISAPSSAASCTRACTGVVVRASGVPGSSARAAKLLGKQAFEGVCASCHGLDGQGGIGPAIASSPTLAEGEPRATWCTTAPARCPRSATRGTTGCNALANYLKASV